MHVPELLLVNNDIDDAVVMPGIHQPHELPTLNAPLPLCWVAEGKRRGATDDEWAVAVDHESLPAYYLSGNPDRVDCRDCRAWMHA